MMMCLNLLGMLLRRTKKVIHLEIKELLLDYFHLHLPFQTDGKYIKHVTKQHGSKEKINYCVAKYIRYIIQIIIILLDIRVVRLDVVPQWRHSSIGSIITMVTILKKTTTNIQQECRLMYVVAAHLMLVIMKYAYQQVEKLACKDKNNFFNKLLVSMRRHLKIMKASNTTKYVSILRELY